MGQDIKSGAELPDGMQLSIARMLASYSADVHRVVINGSDTTATRGWSALGSGGFFPPDMPYGVSLDSELLKGVVGQLGENRDAFTVLATGVAQAGNLTMATGLQSAMADPSLDADAGELFANQLTGANASITRASAALGTVLEWGFGGAEADEQERKKRAETIASVLSLAADLPLVPEIKSEWLKFGVDQAKEQGVDAIKESAATNAEKTFEVLQDDLTYSLRTSVADQLLHNGYLGTVQVTGNPRGGYGVVPHPAEGMDLPPELDAYLLSDTGEILGFDQTSPAYRNWLGNSPLYTYLDMSVTTPFLNQMGFGK